MMKFLMYLFPALINFVTAGVFYYSTQRFVDAKASGLLASLPIPVWAAAYCVMNVIIGKVVKVENAARLIITGGAVIALSSLGFITVPDLYMQFVWIGLLGVGFGLYCTPFQMLCKDFESGKSAGVAAATGYYTAAWSIGFGLGSAAFGLFNGTVVFSLCMGVGVFVALGTRFIESRRKRICRTGTAEEGTGVVTIESRFPDYAWIGWVVGGIGTFTICQWRSQLQPLGEALKIPDAKNGFALVLMVISVVQGLTALYLVRFRVWMYKIMPALCYGLLGAVSLGAACLVRSMGWFFLLAVLYGIYSGCFYFNFVFYALAHPTKAGRNAAVNEIMVSVTSLTAPMLGGLVVNCSGRYWMPFAMAAGCTLAATLFQVICFKLDKRRTAVLKEEVK